jgi:hypothetical protein
LSGGGGTESQAPAVPEPVPPTPIEFPAKAASAKKAKSLVVKAAAKASGPKAHLSVKTSSAPQRKEKPMENTADFNEGLEKVATETGAKAKKAFEKSTALFGEYADFAKGNLEALVESGKILGTGVQSIGSSLVAEGRTALETLTSDARQLAAVKSPTEFFKLQTDILKRNFDNAISLSSKNGEAVMKLASDSFAPISGRVSLAVEKLKTAA